MTHVTCRSFETDWFRYWNYHAAAGTFRFSFRLSAINTQHRTVGRLKLPETPLCRVRRLQLCAALYTELMCPVSVCSCRVERLSYGFTSHSTQYTSFRRRFPKPVSWRGIEKKQNPTQQKHAITNQKKCTTTQNKHTQKLNPGFVAFYDIRPRNRAGLQFYC